MAISSNIPSALNNAAMVAPRFLKDFSVALLGESDLRVGAGMPGKKQDLPRNPWLINQLKVEGIDTVGSIRTKIDVKNGTSCTEHLLGMRLQFHPTTETHTFDSERRPEKHRHQLAQVFVVIKEHTVAGVFVIHRLPWEVTDRPRGSFSPEHP